MTSENPSFRIYQEIGRSSDDTPLITPTSNPPLIEVDTPPIEQCFGLETTDTIADGLLILAPQNQVAEVVALMGIRWQRNVLGQPIQGRGLLVFQYRGHAWTGLLDGSRTWVYGRMLDGSVSLKQWNWDLQAQSLSQQLQTRTIRYWVDDVSDTIGYVYWDNGEQMERLEFDESIFQEKYPVDPDDDDEINKEVRFEPHLFESKLRQLTVADIDAYCFMRNFMREQKAYADTTLGVYSERDDFEQVDYIAFA